MNRDTIARIKKTVQSLAPELEVLRGEKGEKGDSFRWRGKHVEARKYARFDVVTKGRSAYLATEMTSQQPPDAPWVCIAQAVDGEPGERGERGVQGMIGKQGEVGPEGPRGERGEPGLRWAGNYQSGRRYEVGDVVGADGGAYVAIASTEQPPIGGAGWNTLAKGGETGPRGSKGEQGDGITSGAAGIATNIAIGTNALSSSGATGSNQIAIGPNAISGASTGDGTIAIGANALSANTSGNANIAIGLNSQTAINEGANVGIGTSSLRNNTGQGSTGLGNGCLLNLSSGSENTAVGRNAGRFQQDGLTALTGAANSIYIGSRAYGYDNNDGDSIVIGTNARGTGANQTVINNTSTTLTTIEGTSTSVFAVSGDTMRIVTQRNPESTAVGTSGDFAFGTSGGTTFLYFCIADGNWARVALTTGY